MENPAADTGKKQPPKLGEIRENPERGPGMSRLASRTEETDHELFRE
jgi:hypothetical protein